MGRVNERRTDVHQLLSGRWEVTLVSREGTVNLHRSLRILPASATRSDAIAYAQGVHVNNYGRAA
jgi:hypothetical protein